MASMAVFCATALEVAPGLLGRSLAGERDITELVISGRSEEHTSELQSRI